MGWAIRANGWASQEKLIKKTVWKELDEGILNVKVSMNNRPLSYVEDDEQLPVLTPNSLLFGRSNVLLETQPNRLDISSAAKRQFGNVGR